MIVNNENIDKLKILDEVIINENSNKLKIIDEVIISETNNKIIKYQENNSYCNNSKTIEQCGIILLNGSSYPLVLLVHQAESKKWGLPKGHLTDREKQNKNYYFCAKRELFEETGIMLSTNKHRRYNTLLLNRKLFYVVQMFKEFIYVQPIDKNEISDFIWYPILELDKFIKKNECNRTIKDLENVMCKVKCNIKNNSNVFGAKSIVGRYLT